LVTYTTSSAEEAAEADTLSRSPDPDEIHNSSLQMKEAVGKKELTVFGASSSKQMAAG
jgi:hypothetical protein